MRIHFKRDDQPTCADEVVFADLNIRRKAAERNDDGGGDASEGRGAHLRVRDEHAQREARRLQLGHRASVCASGAGVGNSGVRLLIHD